MSEGGGVAEEFEAARVLLIICLTHNAPKAAEAPGYLDDPIPLHGII